MNDRRQIVKLLLTFVVLYLCFVLGNSLLGLYKASSRVGEAESTLAEAKKENDELKMRLEEVKSEEFKEKEVREKLNKQLPGETVIVVPKGVGVTDEVMEGDQNRELANWEKWFALFMN